MTLGTETLRSDLRARSVAFALLGKVLGPDVHPLADPAITELLLTALETAGEDAVATRLEDRLPASLPTVEQLAGLWVKWFDLGRVPPYEASNSAPSAGGITPRLADIAGFYRAFDLRVVGDRPDHVVAQLELLAVLLLVEAEADENGDAERSSIAADATRKFVRDHIGGWVTAWAARVGAIDELAPWFPYAAAAAALVDAEAKHRHVIPLRDDVVLPADAGVADDEEAMMACADTDSAGSPP